MKKSTRITSVLIAAILLATLCFALCGCNNKVIGGDSTDQNPTYATLDGKQLYFTLEIRHPTEQSEKSEGDFYPHSKTDGKLIAAWQVPCYGKTAYESISKFFEERNDSVSFRLSQHRFYMFHEAKLENGAVYNLETSYVAADGKYAQCANFQTLFGEDEKVGTLDDLKVLVIVYQGWLY